MSCKLRHQNVKLTKSLNHYFTVKSPAGGQELRAT